MINLNVPYPWKPQHRYNPPQLHQHISPPPGLPVPAYKDVQTAQSPVNPPVPTIPTVPRLNTQIPFQMAPPPQLQAPPQPQRQQVTYQPAVPRPVSSSSNLMDAETAIEDAPFVELGRHALAQNWCCVKISNVS